MKFYVKKFTASKPTRQKPQVIIVVIIVTQVISLISKIISMIKRKYYSIVEK